MNCEQKDKKENHSPCGHAHQRHFRGRQLAFWWVFYLLTAIGLIWLAIQLKSLIICVLFALTLAAAITPVAEKLEVRKIPRMATVFLVYVTVALIYAGAAGGLLPAVREQFAQLYQHFPSYIARFVDWYAQAKAITSDASKLISQPVSKRETKAVIDAAADELKRQAQAKLLPPTQPEAEGNAAPALAVTPAPQTTSAVGPAADAAGSEDHALTVTNSEIKELTVQIVKKTLDLSAGLVGMTLNAILVLFLTAFFVVEAKEIWTALLQWVPIQNRARCASLIVPLQLRLGSYVRGQFLVCVAVGSFFAVGLKMVGLKYALAVGVLAGLLNLVPYVGSLSATMFALVVAFNQSPMMCVMTLGVFMVEQWAESTFIVPQLLGRTVGLHPLLVMFSILIGGSLLGVAGALVAVPVTLILLYLAEEFYLKPLQAAATESAAAAETAAPNAASDSDFKANPEDASAQGGE